MGLFPKKSKVWPYAADSVGQPRGALNIGGRIGSIPCYETVGSARKVFPALVKDIVGYLEHNITMLQEPDTFVGLSLFMIGKDVSRTKPVVMIVSNDKVLRKAAFRSVRDDSGIMKNYPGFDLGHISLQAEFDLENLQALADASGASSTVCSNESTSEGMSNLQHVALDNSGSGSSSNPTRRLFGSSMASKVPTTILIGKNGTSSCRRLVIRDSTGSTRTAIGGGLVSYQGRYMFHTVQHFLAAQNTENPVVRSFEPEKACSEEEDEECEITGLSDFDDDDGDDFVEITSHGSISPVFELDESAVSETDNDETSTHWSTFHQSNHTAALQSRLESLVHQPPPSGNIENDMVDAGEVCVSSHILDSSFVEVQPSSFKALGLSIADVQNMAIPLDDFADYVEMNPRDAAIRTSTPDGGSIGGACLGTPSYFCLPGSKTFVEVYIAKLNRPLMAGECGSWIRDVVSGKLFGHVVAGSPSTGLALIVPAHRALSSALASLEQRKAESRSDSEQATCEDEPHEDSEDESSNDVADDLKAHDVPKKESLIIVNGGDITGGGDQLNGMTYEVDVDVTKIRFSDVLSNCVKIGKGNQFNTLHTTLTGEYKGTLDLSHHQAGHRNTRLIATNGKTVKKRYWKQKGKKEEVTGPYIVWREPDGTRK